MKNNFKLAITGGCVLALVALAGCSEVDDVGIVRAASADIALSSGITSSEMSSWTASSYHGDSGDKVACSWLLEVAGTDWSAQATADCLMTDFGLKCFAPAQDVVALQKDNCTPADGEYNEYGLNLTTEECYTGDAARHYCGVIPFQGL